MPGTIKDSGYFSTMESLELTPEQEQEFEEYRHLIKPVASGYAKNDPLTSADDLEQMAAVKMINAIRAGYSKGHTKKEGFYVRLIQHSCLTQIRCNHNRAAARSSLNDFNDSIYANDVFNDINDRIDNDVQNREYVDILLSHVKSRYRREILKHKYGLGTYPKTSKEIGDILGRPGVIIRLADSYTVNKLKQKIDKGIIPQWKMTN